MRKKSRISGRMGETMGKEKKATSQPTVKKEPFLKVVKKHWMLLLMLAPAVCYVIKMKQKKTEDSIKRTAKPSVRKDKCSGLSGRSVHEGFKGQG